MNGHTALGSALLPGMLRLVAEDHLKTAVRSVVRHFIPMTNPLCLPAPLIINCRASINSMRD
jgi:hypothetical protein